MRPGCELPDMDFAGKSAAPHCSVKRVGYRDAKVFLAGVEIFGPNSLAASAFRGGHDHAVVEMQAVSRLGLDGARRTIS